MTLIKGQQQSSKLFSKLIMRSLREIGSTISQKKGLDCSHMYQMYQSYKGTYRVVMMHNMFGKYIQIRKEQTWP